ncbi:PREDICTED: beta-hexosaminidase subunit alpha-like isoform X4 [Amphimedon queenslandica]|uniref:Beta-hexosaminidase n=1 Tax=Amphimedon queenslandica TaxID=400682 RepID=A0A1X7U725_AMPQE|nr:PREDICTED: beta-hexosaminidase subunit alpha-like isoform X4 [Amphimedon queenslandica]|eukprot:XP_019855835.1 PREDICTED: beta-hexosaminidase subunit alpha-like isoform X4 [Amphimedon queenslandica]
MALFLLFFLFAVSLRLVFGDSSTTSDLLWPQPSQPKFGTEVYEVDSGNFVFNTTSASTLLKSAMDRYYVIIFQSPAPFFPSGGATQPKGPLTTLYITVHSTDESLNLNTDESYYLNVGGNGASITATTVFGAMRGLETFSQLIYHRPDGGLAINEVTGIYDKPRFQYRGILIDTSRHFVNLHTILTHLDAMVYSKFNILHWHIVDDPSFPYESYTFPDLAAKGAFDHEHIYTQEDVKTVINYAYERGIRVIPEFDTPGHTQSWGAGQPDLLTPCYANGQPNGEYGPVNPILNSTWTFLTSLYQEIDNVFPDNYIHLGGDEVSFTCWQGNPDIQAWMKKMGYTDYAKLEEYYENNLIDLVNKLNKSYVVWQEIFDNGLKIKMDTVIDVWKTGWEKEMDAVTKAGYKVILSTCWYLNRISYGEDWKDYYSCDPQNFNGTDDQNSLVVGGHSCLWGELIDSTNFMSRMWPRACAVGERLWSPKTVTDVNDARTRLLNQRCRLLTRGIQAEPVGPSYCNDEWHGP